MGSTSTPLVQGLNNDLLNLLTTELRRDHSPVEVLNRRCFGFLVVFNKIIQLQRIKITFFLDDLTQIV